MREIGDKDRVDIILTNPPFGGAEEPGIQGNFPKDKQTAETALLFLQLIMRKLRRPIRGKKGGRCGVVVPDGTLFAAGVAARIKKQLIENFNLHTIVKLPKGVFAPYADIKTNLLFFERNGVTKGIWYYEHPLPPERQHLKNPCYTKSKPLRYEEFQPLLEWWNNREENEYAWKVPVQMVMDNDYNLNSKNPLSLDEEKLSSPKKLIDEILEKEKQIGQLVIQIREELDSTYDQ